MTHYRDIFFFSLILDLKYFPDLCMFFPFFLEFNKMKVNVKHHLFFDLFAEIRIK